MSAFSVTVAESEAVRVPAPALAALVATIFERVGVPPVDAHLAAAALVDADLRGVDSHGVSHLLPDYVQGCRTGAINPTPAWRVVRETPATASVDGDRGLGVVLGPQAMAIAIGKARQTGVGMVTVQHAGHLGMAQHHAMLALPHDMIGVALAATEPLMVPTFGRDPRLGTNPIAVAAPCAEEPPFVYDAATTAVAGTKIYAAHRRGLSVPGGLLADADGSPMLAPQPAPDPALYQGLLPLGSTPELGSHKGYGLACVVEVLGNVLGGLTFGMRAGPDRHGHFLAAVDVGAFSAPDAFKRAMDDFVRALKATPPAAGHQRVLAPGQLEWETQQERSARGIPLHREVVAWFDALCADLGLRERLPRLA